MFKQYFWILSNFGEIRLPSPSAADESTSLIDGRKRGKDSCPNTADGYDFRKVKIRRALGKVMCAISGICQICVLTPPPSPSFDDKPFL